MKKLLCFLLCLTLIFSSINLCFATPVSWDSYDSQHLTEIRNTFMSGGGMYNIVNAINSNLTTIDSHLNLIYQAIDPSSSGSTANILNTILNMLSYTDAGGALKSFIADIDFTLDGIYLKSQDIDSRFLLKSYPSYYQDNPNTAVRYYYYNGDTVQVDTYTPSSNPILGSLMLHLWGINRSVANMAEVQLKNSTNQQTYTDWTSLTNSTFTPASSFDALNKWLSKIQTPVARLSYVLASNERIEAQEAAAANEEAVVDNFIDSSGDGSASPSDIGSVSDLSSGYKQNFGSDASVSGIFNIFDSNNMGWFSQETKNQLDTSTPTRLTKGSDSETPLLDKQIEDIYNALGVKQP